MKNHSGQHLYQSNILEFIISNTYQLLFYVFYFLFFIFGTIFPEETKLLIVKFGTQFFSFFFDNFDPRIIYSITLVSIFVLLEFFRSLLPLMIGSILTSNDLTIKTNKVIFMFLLLILFYYISSVYSVAQSPLNTINIVKNFGTLDFFIDFISTFIVACSLVNIVAIFVEKFNAFYRK